MARTLTKDDIFDLPVEERLHLIEALWDSIDHDQLLVPESHQRALDRELEEYRKNPKDGRTWGEVRDKLLPKR